MYWVFFLSREYHSKSGSLRRRTDRQPLLVHQLEEMPLIEALAVELAQHLHPDADHFTAVPGASKKPAAGQLV